MLTNNQILSILNKTNKLLIIIPSLFINYAFSLFSFSLASLYTQEPNPRSLFSCPPPMPCGGSGCRRRRRSAVVVFLPSSGGPIFSFSVALARSCLGAVFLAASPVWLPVRPAHRQIFPASSRIFIGAVRFWSRNFPAALASPSPAGLCCVCLFSVFFFVFFVLSLSSLIRS